MEMETCALLREIYDRLLSAYGPQGWWPVTRDEKRGPEYFPGRYDHPWDEEGMWEIIVGAVLTQNTAWKNVERALRNLWAEGLMGVESLANVDVGRLAELIRPSGYYNQKARRLKDVAEYFLRRWDGDLKRFFSRPTDEIREELLSIRGIGEETADSILLYAGGHPVFVVDAYTRRLLERVGVSCSKKYVDVQGLFHRCIRPDVAVYREYHALIVEHAKRHCRKKPVCEGCPLRDLCVYPES